MSFCSRILCVCVCVFLLVVFLVTLPVASVAHDVLFECIYALDRCRFIICPHCLGIGVVLCEIRWRRINEDTQSQQQPQYIDRYVCVCVCMRMYVCMDVSMCLCFLPPFACRGRRMHARAHVCISRMYTYVWFSDV